MKKYFNEKIRLVLIVAVCVILVAVTFSIAAKEPLNGSKFEKENEDLITKSSNPTPRPFRPLPLPEWFYKIFNYDWNYWSNPPHLYTIPEGNIGIGTTSPTAKFEVGGAIKATSFVGDGSGLINVPHFGVSSIIYTGQGFDTYLSTQGKDENDYEFIPINASDLNNTKYLKIKILGVAGHNLWGTGRSAGLTSLKIQTRDVGGVYSDSMRWVDFFKIDKDDQLPSLHITIPINIEWIHELTSTEKTNGVQVRIFSRTWIWLGDGSAAFGNYQTVIMPI
ncbi:MAG: hypothetical protein JSW60_09020 [Thermoplasmatales archaeon]|nr:MAG: hypothetical protein JSW60_09020 [Thermoplasmatales archaeon]